MKKWIVILVTLAAMTLVVGTASAKAVGTIVFGTSPIGSPVLLANPSAAK